MGHSQTSERRFRLIVDYRGDAPVHDQQLASLRTALGDLDVSVHGRVDEDSIGFDIGVSASDFGAAVVAGTEVLAGAMTGAGMDAYELVAVEVLTVDEHARRRGWSNRRPVGLAELDQP